MNPKEPPETQTHHILGVIRQIRQASCAADFNGELNLRLDKRLRQMRTEGIFLGKSVISLAANRQAEGDKRRSAPWIIVGGFGSEYGVFNTPYFISRVPIWKWI